jgi:phenylacetate-coenzyme A ligase PaaK-like adenylate-forming protein
VQQTSNEQIDALIRGPQYARPQAEKEALLAPLLGELCLDVAARCPPYARFLNRLGGTNWQTLADIPPLPVSAFKQFLLSAVPPQQVVRELHSSATTGQQPSRIPIDKTTAFRLSRALASILKEHIGGDRRPFLVLDAAESAAAGDSLTARGAAIRGVGNFATETLFGMDLLPARELVPNWERIAAFFDRHGSGPVLLFGFTFIVWSRFVQEAERTGREFRAPGAVLLHSGGWKKLAADAVSKEQFRERTAAVLGCDPAKIFDFYGMVEQVGTVFVDCEAGNKHAPAFADVLIRRPLTLAPVEIGESGIIEVLSALPSSYPGQAIITEDQGVLVGIDGCPCGRRGRHFRFTRRIEQAEVRGCGDTFAQSRDLR